MNAKEIYINYNIYSIMLKFLVWAYITMKMITVDLFFYRDHKISKNNHSMVMNVQLMSVIQNLKLYFFHKSKYNRNRIS